MGANDLKSWQGKSLKQWTADIAHFCKGSTERKCTGTDSIEVLQAKMEMNYRCLLARSAVQYFYNPPETQEEKKLDETHKRAIQDAMSSYAHCHTLLMVKYREEGNLVKKAFALLQMAQQQEKKGAKVDESKSKRSWKEISEALASDTIKRAFDKKTGEADATLLKKQEAVLKKMESEAEGWDARKIKFRK